MNPRDELPDQGKLPLPSPRSPDQLDQTILSYARENAPPKKRALQPAWMAGVATTCLVVLALFISEPKQQAPGLDSDVPLQKVEIQPGPQAAMKARSVGEQRSTMTAKAKPKSTSARFAPPANLEDESAVLAADVPMRELADSSRLQEELAAPAAGAAYAEPASTLRSQIEQCAQLLDSGNEQQARKAYSELRQQCPQCGLPDSLEVAIERYLKY